MSLSTCAFCDNSASFFSGMAQILCTPRIKRSPYPVKSQPETLQKCPVLKDAWASELGGRMHTYNKPVDKFIEYLVPCSQPYNESLHPAQQSSNKPGEGAFGNYNPGPGREKLEYDNIVSGCRNLVKRFPAAKKLQFANTHSKILYFPFHAFVDHHHSTYPDISVSFPGKRLDTTSGSWQSIAMVIESKSDASQDPFGREGQVHTETIEQLAKNARNLMLTHGFLAAFVVGIYGRNVRIARFDHSCALVSQSFDIKSKKGSMLLQKFFWHFVHPRVGDTVVGADPTVMKLDLSSQQWVKNELQRAQVTHWQKHCQYIEAEGRRVEVYDEQTGRCVPYLLYQLLDVNGRLFSRATMVWRAIEDTRIWKRGQLVPDPSRTAPVKPRILKEAWRQLVRTAEAKFYQRLNAKIPRKDWFGLATMVCGGDLGEFELRWWKETIRRREEGRPHAATDSTSPPGPSNPAPSSRLFSSTGSTASPAASSVASPRHYIPHEDFPLPYPQHQTYSWQLIMGKEECHRDRSHMRMVIDDVGRPLTRFKNTLQLVRAIRDAIKGHQLAWEKAQVMHRDISVGNILISEKKDTKYVGFLHDYDYSAMNPDPSDAKQEGSPSEAKPSNGDPTKTAADPEDAALHKERTGTYYFMAYEILQQPKTIHDTHHDLESFYWVLMWVIARHTDHGNEHRDALCNEIFKFGDDGQSASAKRNWLEIATFDVPNNKPLSQLLLKLTRTVVKQIPLPNRDDFVLVPLTYKAVLELFDEAIAMPGWPNSDWKPCPVLKGDTANDDASDLDGPAAQPDGLVSAPALLGPSGVSAKQTDVGRPNKRRCETIPEDEVLQLNPRTNEPAQKRAKREKEWSHLGPPLVTRSKARAAVAVRSEPVPSRSTRLQQYKEEASGGRAPPFEPASPECY